MRILLSLLFMTALAVLTTCPARAIPDAAFPFGEIGLSSSVLVNGGGVEPWQYSRSPDPSLFPSAIARPVSEAVGRGITIPLPDGGTLFGGIEAILIGWAVFYLRKLLQRFRPPDEPPSKT